MAKATGSKGGKGRGRGRGGGRASVAREASSPTVDVDFTFPRVETFDERQSKIIEQLAGATVAQSSLVRNDAGDDADSDPPASTADAKAASERQERSARGQKLCDAIDAEVASRAAIIRAHMAARASALHAQVDLQLSKVSLEEQNDHVDDFMMSFLETIKAGKQNMSLPQSELPSIFARAADDMTRLASSALNTPCFGPDLQDIRFAKRNKTRRTEQVSNPDMTSWPDYHSWLQSLGYQTGTTALGKENFNTPMNLKRGTTPKTVRLPKPGESMLSINGSPLGKFGETPGSAGGSRITRSHAQVKSSKRSLRDL